jgi:hypothetical protein
VRSGPSTRCTPASGAPREAPGLRQREGLEVGVMALPQLPLATAYLPKPPRLCIPIFIAVSVRPAGRAGASSGAVPTGMAKRCRTAEVV